MAPPRHGSGRILTEALVEKGLTQDDLGVLIGINRRHIHNMCRGYAGITPQMAILLANGGVQPPARYVEHLTVADPAEQWAMLSAADRVFRLRADRPELEPMPKKALQAAKAVKAARKKKPPAAAAAKKKEK